MNERCEAAGEAPDRSEQRVEGWFTERYKFASVPIAEKSSPDTFDILIKSWAINYH